MPIPEWFSTVGYEDVEALVEEAEPSWWETNHAFYEGDHWQDGDGWVGPKPSKSEEGYDTALKEIKAAFTSKNVIREIVERHESGVTGKEPAWSLAPRDPSVLQEGGTLPEALQAAADEATTLLRSWLEDEDKTPLSIFQEAVDALLYSSRSSLRLFVPQGLIEAGRVPSGDPPDQLGRIYVDLQTPDMAMVYEDPDTRAKLSIVTYEVELRESGTAERTEQRAEIAFVNDAGDTVIRVLTPEGEILPDMPANAPEDAEPAPIMVSLGGRLPIFEMERGVLITEQVRQSQRALNLANSMIPRNVVTGGFLERVLLNAQLPGSWQVVDQATGKKRFVPDPLVFGAGTVNAIRGIPVEGEDGEVKSITNPSVQYREPVPITASDDAKKSHYRDVLEEVDQAHVLIAGDAAASGRSREVARIDFEKSLLRTKQTADMAWAWLLETVLAMAEAFAGSPGRYTERLRIVADCQLDTGPLSTAEETALADQVEKGLLSKVTAMAKLGVEDIEGELQRLERQEGAKLDLRTRQAAVIQAFARSGLGLVEAAKLAGFDDQEAEAVFGQAEQDRRAGLLQGAAFDALVKSALAGGSAGNGSGSGAGAAAAGASG